MRDNILLSLSEREIETAFIGDLWIDTYDNKLYRFQGEAWVLIEKDRSGYQEDTTDMNLMSKLLEAGR